MHVGVAESSYNAYSSPIYRGRSKPKSMHAVTLYLVYRARHRLSNTYYSRMPLQQKLKDFRIIQWHHRVGQYERYLHTNFEADRTNHVGTMTN